MIHSISRVSILQSPRYIEYISVTTKLQPGFITTVIRAPVMLRPGPDAALNCEREKTGSKMLVCVKKRESEVMHVCVCVCVCVCARVE